MDRNESEQILKETIVYANREIQKAKRRSMCFAVCTILSLMLLIFAWQMLVHYEIPVAYREGLVSVEIPVDAGIDIHVKLQNYKKANALLVKTGDRSYDLYIGIMQTAATKYSRDSDTSNHLLRVGNGIIVDYQGNQLLGYLPEGVNEESIAHVYYLDDLSANVAVKTDQELMESENKTLIWKRDS